VHGPRFRSTFTSRLKLPDDAKLHDVFHVGLLKPFKGEPPTQTSALPPIRHGRACAEPEMVLCARLARRSHEVLIHWKGLAAVKATWTDLEDFHRLYPSFQLADEMLAEEGRDVMLDIQY
jgi:hypothetical protein